MPRARQTIIYVAAPSGQMGGGMGRVKDYILAANDTGLSQVRFEPLVTRDDRGFAFSLWLTLRAALLIGWMRLTGRLALAHMNLGDKASAARKGLLTVLGRAMGATVVVHLHAAKLVQTYNQAGPVVRWMITLPFRVASTNIVLGEVWRRWLIDELGVAPGKVDILANGVPSAPYAPRDHLSPRTPVRLLFLGNLMERKGVTDLIEALALLPADLPDWSLTLAGGGEIERYRGLAAARGLTERVVGWVGSAQALALLGVVDAMVLPSYDEGLPLVILEALGAGTPVVCTPVGAIPEFLQDGETALFVAPGDQPGLAAALGRVIAEPALRQHLGDTGRSSYQRTFSLEAFQSALFDIYRRQVGIDVV